MTPIFVYFLYFVVVVVVVVSYFIKLSKYLKIYFILDVRKRICVMSCEYETEINLCKIYKKSSYKY